jgi:hypothetical protein
MPDFSPPILGLEGESFDTPFSLEVVKWKERALTLEEFPTPDFTTPPPIRVVAVIEGETFVTYGPSYLSPNAQPFPFSPRSTTQSHLFELHLLLVLLQFMSKWQVLILLGT